MKSITEQLPRSQWIILNEDYAAIQKAKDYFTLNAQRLNQLHTLTPITSQQAFAAIHANPQQWIFEQMRKDKKVRELETTIDITLMKVPEPLKRIGELASKPIDFCVLDFRENEWCIDSLRFEIYCDQFRDLIKEPDQLERYKLANSIAELFTQAITQSEFSSAQKIYHLPSFLENLVEIDRNREHPFNLSTRFIKTGRVFNYY